LIYKINRVTGVSSTNEDSILDPVASGTVLRAKLAL
jgi:hypothetical protein